MAKEQTGKDTVEKEADSTDTRQLAGGYSLTQTRKTSQGSCCLLCHTDILTQVMMVPPGQAYGRYIWDHYQT